MKLFRREVESGNRTSAPPRMERLEEGETQNLAQSRTARDEQVSAVPSPSSSRIQRRQSRNRIRRISFQTKQENDARLALYRRERRLAVMAKK